MSRGRGKEEEEKEEEEEEEEETAAECTTARRVASGAPRIGGTGRRPREYVVQSMWCDLRDAIYVVQLAWFNLCGVVTTALQQ